MARRTDGGRSGGSRRSTVQTRRRRVIPAVAIGAMGLGIAGLLALLPAVSNACQVVPATSRFSSAQVSAATAPGSDVLIVGDSYTTGRGSSDNLHGWAQDLVAERDWDATIDGGPGTGYVNRGAARSARAVYQSRIERRAALSPDLVLVQGSQNDWLTSSATLERTVESTLRQAEEQWPDAVVIAIGPSAPQPRAQATTGINAAVAAGARAADVPFVDALDGQWFTAMNSGSYAATDDEHLNDAGYRYLAGKIDAELEDLATKPDGEQCL